MPITTRTLSAAALLFASPYVAQAQLSISGVSITEIERAVRVAEGLRRRSSSDAAPVTRAVTTARRLSALGGAVARAGSGRAVGSSAVSTGAKYLGTRYRWGGSTPAGFDCSGFVQYVYRKNGVPLPRTSRQMAHAGERIPPFLESLREGDLMLFRDRSGRIGHVALYAGRNRILHSSSTGRGVRYDDLTSERGAYYLDRLVGVRRVTDNGAALVEALDRILRDFPFDYYDPPDLAPRLRP